MSHIREDSVMTNVEQQIIKLFDAQDKDYLTLKTLKTNSQIKKLLQLTEKMSNTEIKKKLLPHVEHAIKIVKGYKGLYVMRNISDTNLIFNRIRKKPCSLKSLKVYFPVQTKELAKLVSQMVRSGQLCAEFSEKSDINLSIHDSKTDHDYLKTQKESAPQASHDRQKMKAAYDHVGGGRSFVRIYAMREFLKWSRQRFDRALEKLTKELAIQLHIGDPSVLTEKQLEDSFVDDEGQVCITITWRDV